MELVDAKSLGLFLDGSSDELCGSSYLGSIQDINV